MRGPRIKNDQARCFLHCFNRTAGWKGDEPFGDVEREYLFQLAERLQEFYSIEIISFVCMANHWHALVCTYPEAPKPGEVIRRFRAFYGNSRPEPNWDDPDVVARYASRMRDVSCFAKDLQQRFTCWFNRSTGHCGRLWADRYKSVVLDGNHALWECLKYLEMNPVRAGYCNDPADYRFCSWGRYCGSGRHPFAAAFEKHLTRYHADKGDNLDLVDVANLLRTEIARVTAYERGESANSTEVSGLKLKSLLPFHLYVTRRVRYWSDGAIIGSKAFVQKFATSFFGTDYVTRKRMTESTPVTGENSLFSLRQLRNTSYV